MVLVGPCTPHITYGAAGNGIKFLRLRYADEPDEQEIIQYIKPLNPEVK